MRFSGANNAANYGAGGYNATGSSSRGYDSPRTMSQKKAVRLMLNEPDGSVSIEPASPATS